MKTTKKVTKKVTKKKPAALKRIDAGVKKWEKQQEKTKAAIDAIDSDFENFCKKRGLKAICFFAHDKLTVVGEMASKGLKNYEREGLVEVND